MRDLLGQDPDDSFARMAIPESGFVGTGGMGQLVEGITDNSFFLRTGKDVSTVGDGRWSLGILPKGDARDTEHGGFFLEATRICQH